MTGPNFLDVQGCPIGLPAPDLAPGLAGMSLAALLAGGHFLPVPPTGNAAPVSVPPFALPDLPSGPGGGGTNVSP